MIRREWKPRGVQDQKKGKERGEEKDRDRMVVEDSDGDEDSSEEEVQEADVEELEKTPRPNVRSLHPASPPRATNTRAGANADVDALAEGMSSLSLVPSSIRFGRGGRGGGLGARGRGRGGRGGIVPPQGTTSSGHQRSASTSSVTESGQLGAGGAGGGRGRRGRKGKGHRVSASIGTGMEVDVSGGEGSDVVLLPPAGHASGERGRGSRGRKGGRGGAT